ncbi:hypothetical protein PVAP13_6KG319000 [Panicum virgatum]|uniref:Secreted protein n=1 Tax=Panicum virgatum TaxID=38727 RepID=A0A8T0RF72_PANVG|nr:hypothetical protein PVAP13_6KG319000 [Panicum virgatum]
MLPATDARLHIIRLRFGILLATAAATARSVSPALRPPPSDGYKDQWCTPGSQLECGRQETAAERWSSSTNGGDRSPRV